MSDDPSPDELRAAGRLAEAAQAYRRRGELARAEKLYADLWDFRAAAEVALERGDRIAALGHFLSANDPVAAAEVGDELEHGTEIELRRAAEVYERHRRYVEAAALRERLGELPAARDLYRRGQALLEVARIERALGRLREAGLTYEQLLAREPDGEDAPRARLELAQLLGSLDRPEEAVRHLQAALPRARADERKAVYEELIVALDRLGYLAAADEIHAELSALEPATPPRAELIARHLPTPAGGAPRLAGRYEVERLLGAGASGRVFLAKDVITGRTVAIKALATSLERRAAAGWASFFAEAKLVGTLRHPNVVEIIEVDEARGLIVMEYVAGGTLLDRLSPPGAPPRPLSTAAVRRLLLDVLDALAAVHVRGIVHRDLKPANLFLSPTGDLKLGDFGAAHLFSEEATQTAGFVGTLAYMAPEQMSGARIDFAADLYALGAVAFHALTGRLPFPGPDFVSQHLGDPPPRPSSLRPGLDPRWDALVVQLLAKDPRARASSVDEVRRAVENLPADDEPTPGALPPEPSNDEATTRDALAQRYVRHSALPDGAGGPIALGADTRLGRTVVLETLGAAYLATEAGAAHLAWLRQMARRAGPRVQRILAFSPRSDEGIDVVFEAPGPRTAPGDRARAAQLILHSLAPVHAEGMAHGTLAHSIHHEAHGPVVLLAGRAPRPGATVAGDRAELQSAL